MGSHVFHKLAHLSLKTGWAGLMSVCIFVSPNECMSTCFFGRDFQYNVPVILHLNGSKLGSLLLNGWLGFHLYLLLSFSHLLHSPPFFIPLSPYLHCHSRDI